jgi:hypothetical protein
VTEKRKWESDNTEHSTLNAEHRTRRSGNGLTTKYTQLTKAEKYRRDEFHEFLKLSTKDVSVRLNRGACGFFGPKRQGAGAV